MMYNVYNKAVIFYIRHPNALCIIWSPAYEHQEFVQAIQ